MYICRKLKTMFEKLNVKSTQDKGQSLLILKKENKFLNGLSKAIDKLANKNKKK
jgi:hypothetical protein